MRLPDTLGYELVCAGTVGGAGSVLVVSSARSGQVRFAFPVGSVKVVGVRSVPCSAVRKFWWRPPRASPTLCPPAAGTGDLERFAQRLK